MTTILTRVAGLLALSIASSAQAFIIDDFLTTQSRSVGPGTGSSASSNTGGAHIAGNRNLGVNVLTNLDGNTLSLDSGAGRLNLDKSLNITGSAFVMWANIGNIFSDFTVAGSHNSIEFTILENSDPSIDLSFQVFDNSSNVSTYSLDDIPLIAAGSPQSFAIPFSGFSDFIGSADFSDVLQLSLTIDVSDSTSEANIQFDYLQTALGASASPVPIPAAAWLFSSGLIGLIGIARRSKNRFTTE